MGIRKEHVRQRYKGQGTYEFRDERQSLEGSEEQVGIVMVRREVR